jgi:hypothetical protein
MTGTGPVMGPPADIRVPKSGGGAVAGEGVLGAGADVFGGEGEVFGGVTPLGAGVFPCPLVPSPGVAWPPSQHSSIVIVYATAPVVLMSKKYRPGGALANVSPVWSPCVLTLATADEILGSSTG